MTNQERIAAVQKLGYSERQASFLVLAALHGGYFLQRQYNSFLGQVPGGCVERFIGRATSKRHVTAHESANRTIIYHVAAKPFFELIGEEDNRNRRWRQPYSVKVKLMGLDYVLAHREHHYLATETEKLDYFVGQLKLDPPCLPGRVYHSKDRRSKTTKYFVDKFPVFLSSEPDAPRPLVTFCYVDGSHGKPSGFHTYLFQYGRLLGRLDAFRVVYVAANGAFLERAGRIFSPACGPFGGPGGIGSDSEGDRILEHFRARKLFEQRLATSFDKRRLDQFRDEMEEFGGPDYDSLYRQWQEEGDGVVLDRMGVSKRIQASFVAYRLPYDYKLFDSLPMGVSA